MPQPTAFQTAAVVELCCIYQKVVAAEDACTQAQKDISSKGLTFTQAGKEQLSVLVNLQQSLFDQYYDFFLISLGPLASSDLRRLSKEYPMPPRMWKHCVEDPLRVLLEIRPRPLEHIWNFFTMAYNMLCLLYETVPELHITWAECLGDLSRCYQEIRHEEQSDPESWRGTSWFWLCKVSDVFPTTGRLYRHLAIVAPDGSVKQLFYFIKSVRVYESYPVTRQLVSELFERQEKPTSKVATFEYYFVKAHIAIWFGGYRDNLQDAIDSFFEVMDLFIDRDPDKWLSIGPYMAAILGCATIQPTSGAGRSTVMHLLLEEMRKHAYNFTILITNRILARDAEDVTLPFIHTLLVWVSYVVERESWLDRSFPWPRLVGRLNRLVVSIDFYQFNRYDINYHFPIDTDMSLCRPLPEDFMLRGLPYANDSCPKDWFTGTDIGESERNVEYCWMPVMRKRRILSLACGIAHKRNIIQWNPTTRKFSHGADLAV